MKNPVPFLLGQISFLFAVQCGAAHAVTILSHDSDGAVYRLTSNATGTFPTQDLIVGGTDNANYAGIAIFELPDLGVGGSISAATLTFTVTTGGTMPNANVDIYGLGYLSSTPSLQGVWQLASDTETRNGNTLGTNLGTDLPVKLVNNAVTAGTSMTVNSTTVVTGANLVDFLNDLYSTYGAEAGDYVVFRINPDADGITPAGANIRYGGSHQPDARRTRLDVTIVPEVSGVLLTAFGASGLLLRRRRN